MKIDRIKEEVANIRRTQNVIMIALISLIGYLFTAFNPYDLKIVLSVVGVGFLVFFLGICNVNMKYKLKELEKTKSED